MNLYKCCEAVVDILSRNVTELLDDVETLGEFNNIVTHKGLAMNGCD